jgi:phage baseplate assembly protein W
MAEVTTYIPNTIFKDLDMNFTAHPVKKDVSRNLNEMAIINSVKNLVLTNHYERPFQPQIGSNVRKLLFENVDNFIASQLESALEETVTNFEPRVRISKITAVPSPDENKYDIKMEFFIINQTTPITIKFFLERVR